MERLEQFGAEKAGAAAIIRQRCQRIDHRERTHAGAISGFQPPYARNSALSNTVKPADPPQQLCALLNGGQTIIQFFLAQNAVFVLRPCQGEFRLVPVRLQNLGVRDMQRCQRLCNHRGRNTLPHSLPPDPGQKRSIAAGRTLRCIARTNR